MFKGNRKYIILLCTCFAVLIFIQYNTPKPIDWRQTYAQKDKIPYGTYALFEVMKDIFPDKEIKTVDRPAYNTLNENMYHNHNYIFISNSFSPDKLDALSLLHFVSKGNNAFIASNYFYAKLADTLNLKTDIYYDYYDVKLNDTSALNTVTKALDTLKINFTSPYVKSAKGYVYGKGVENAFFTSFDSLQTTILGTNQKGKANYVKIKFGKGYFYLSTLPEVFSNYQLVDEKNCEYVYKALSYLPVQNVLWDEYYKAYSKNEESPIRFILQNPALRTAYFLLILSIIVFVIFGAKRNQRIIPVVEPLKNTTLEFVEIVGTLYYHKGDHKNIATKKINYFLEYIRSVFFVKSNLFDDTFIKKVVNLSGIAEAEVRELFNFITIISSSSIIREEEILKLNSMIEKFQQQSKR